MRKIISILLVAIMLLTFLTGCGGGEDNKVSYPETVTANLKEGVDYTDHASTYDGEGLTYLHTSALEYDSYIQLKVLLEKPLYFAFYTKCQYTQ